MHLMEFSASVAYSGHFNINIHFSSLPKLLRNFPLCVPSVRFVVVCKIEIFTHFPNFHKGF